MDSNWGQGMKRLVEAYDWQSAQSEDSLQRMRSVSATVTSADGAVSVTVGSQGEVRELHFLSRTYRQMAPAELSSLVLDTITRARDSALQQVEENLPRTMLGGVGVRDLLSGEVEWSEVLPERRALDELWRRAGFTAPGERRPSEGRDA